MKRQLKDFNFLNDLNQRINPEKSRNFNREDLLKKISRLMETGNQDPFKTPEGTLRFGIIGSNGKGSTSQILSFYLNNSLPGLYTSPHLKSVTERIQIQNQNLDHEEFNALYFEMLHILKEDHYSYFEILTILSMYIFNLKKCKYQIYEAGIGGRFDATRMARPQAVILTGISLEHTQILGNSLSEILDEKLALLGGYTKHFFYPAYLDPILPGIIDRVHIINPQITIHPFHMNPELLKQNYLKFNDFYAGF
ncbi:MAG: Mur ligase family protein, partial [Spirochaetia bacterium]|nr:Mur ligase family protein [Spirochaetia bacterium]